MTQFEFISVAVSIVLALSVARLLSALPHVLAPDRRYWVHAVWLVMLLPPHLGFWWAVWSYRDVDPWTFRGFASTMLTPGLLFMTLTALVTETPGTVASWRSHFLARRRLFFSLAFATICSIPFRQFVVLGDAAAPFFEGDVLLRRGVIFAAILAIFASGIISTSERVHALLVLLMAGLTLINFALI